MARMTFRLTEEMRAWLECQAAKNGRTMNGELVESIRKMMEKTNDRIMEMELFRIEKEAMAREAEQKQQSA
jgi:plasmid stability protein